MCSTSVQRIARIGQAIDELAAEAEMAYAVTARKPPLPGEPEPSLACDPAAAGTVRADGADRVVIRLAELWALLAELDPEVASRLPTYEA